MLVVSTGRRRSKMALPLLRCCSRLHSVFSSNRLILNQNVTLTRFCRTRVMVLTPGRFYSSDKEYEKRRQKVVVVGIPNPFIWIRTRIYYFLIKAYFDKEFSIEEFTEGAKRAFSHVSRLLAQCQFEALDGLVAKDLIGKLEEKCSLLPSEYKKALSADPDDIMYTTPGDVGIFYDENGRKFVSILMRFWYLTSAQVPDDGLKGTRTFKVAIGDEDGEAETKRLLTAIYEFQREFTKGVPPEWTITRVEHSKLLD
ncbi:m-AAA protease-interacting protein 1, mitochondrial [Nothobranchius furzeri]|uniref:Matrix AAA peptidase interacting protein 1 n=6 Tax=Nothobranchius TaxID=28779 RepID=A0A8C6MBK9_NOTFU|nr:m-AAA protease-interacting protein 1, mitochondrial [Nothobranchius furzeri]